MQRHNLEVRRDPAGRVSLVNVAQYDRLRGERGDLSHAQTPAAQAARAAEAEAERPSTDPVYTREQARHMAYAAELKRLDVEERLGRLVPVDRLDAEIARVLTPVKQVIDRLERRADELAEAVQRGGRAGARAWLGRFAYEFSNEIAAAAGALLAEFAAEPSRPMSDLPPPSGVPAET